MVKTTLSCNFYPDSYEDNEPGIIQAGTMMYQTKVPKLKLSATKKRKGVCMNLYKAKHIFSTHLNLNSLPPPGIFLLACQRAQFRSTQQSAPRSKCCGAHGSHQVGKLRTLQIAPPSNSTESKGTSKTISRARCVFSLHFMPCDHIFMPCSIR
jgi:hypothetical protein